LALFIVKELVSLSYVEALILGGCSWDKIHVFNFSFKQAFVNEIFLRIVEETKEKYVFHLKVL
jgi:hypothetical protein